MSLIHDALVKARDEENGKQQTALHNQTYLLDPMQAESQASTSTSSKFSATKISIFAGSLVCLAMLFAWVAFMLLPGPKPADATITADATVATDASQLTGRAAQRVAAAPRSQARSIESATSPPFAIDIPAIDAITSSTPANTPTQSNNPPLPKHPAGQASSLSSASTATPLTPSTTSSQNPPASPLTKTHRATSTSTSTSSSRPNLASIAGQTLIKQIKHPALSMPINLDAIMWSPSNPIAMINGNIIKPGDALQEIKLIAIHKKRVTLQAKGVTFYLRLP